MFQQGSTTTDKAVSASDHESQQINLLSFQSTKILLLLFGGIKWWNVVQRLSFIRGSKNFYKYLIELSIGNVLSVINRSF